jgi:hypothetical protein
MTSQYTFSILKWVVLYPNKIETSLQTGCNSYGKIFNGCIAATQAKSEFHSVEIIIADCRVVSIKLTVGYPV